MEVRILWSDTSQRQLQDIFDYYSLKAGIRVAKKVVNEIVEKSIQLEMNPLIGPKEPLLEQALYDYHYLVVRNYKIIYRFNNQIIWIVSVFDCRQNPTKINVISE
jgi:toxin ParE1/3/4